MGGAANTVCADWQWFNDDVGHTTIENAHTDLSSPDSYLDTTIGIRWLLDNTGGMDETDGYKIQYRVNAGSWVDVTTSSSYVKAVNGTQNNDGDGTSQELGAGTFDEGYWDEDGSVASYTLTSGQESENEHYIQFVGADCSGNTVEVKVVFSGGSDLDGYTYSDPSCTFAAAYTLAQPNFRIYDGIPASINDNTNWQWAINTDGTWDAGVPFGLRVEAEETASSTYTGQFKLQYRRKPSGGAYGSWTDVMNRAEDGTSEPVQCLTAGTFSDGDATTNVLSGSGRTFEAGHGNHDRTTYANNALNNEHTEHVFIVMFALTWGDANILGAGDDIDLRLVEASGSVFAGSYQIPTITVSIPTGYMGLIPPETSGDSGPFEDEGNLYTVGEPASTSAYYDPHVMKSTDGGDTWAFVDTANNPTTGDIEGWDSHQDGDTIHFLMQDGSGSSDVTYHTFRTSSHSTNPDTWGTIDEAVATPGTAPADQACGLRRRSDGSLVAVYRVNDGSNERVVYKIKNGSWGSETSVDTTASTDFVLSGVVLGEGDNVYIFYRSSGNLYCKQLNSSDTLGARKTIATDAITAHADHKAMFPPVYWDSSGVEKVMAVYQKDTTDDLYSVVLPDNGTPGSAKQVTTVAIEEDPGSVGSRQPVGHLLIDTSDDTAYCLFVYASDGDIYMDEAVDDGGWGTDSSVLSGTQVDQMTAGLFTHSAGNGGAKVLGMFVGIEPPNTGRTDTHGDEGFTWYKEEILQAGATFPPVPGLREISRSPLLRM